MRPENASANQSKLIQDVSDWFKVLIDKDENSLYHSFDDGTELWMGTDGRFVITLGSLIQIGQKDYRIGRTLWSSELDIEKMTLIERPWQPNYVQPPIAKSLDIMHLVGGRLIDIVSDWRNGVFLGLEVAHNHRIAFNDWEAILDQEGFTLYNIGTGEFFFDHLTTV